MFDDRASVIAAIRAGARGYLVKGADRAEILRAVHAAAAGDAIFTSAAAGHLTDHLAVSRPVAQPAAVFPGLTPCEHEILRLLSAGLTNAAISERFRLSPKTVRNNVSAILAKLEVETRAEAVAKARAAGLTDGR